MKIQDIYNDIIKIRPISDEATSFLEIGPGEGKFSNFVQEHGVQVTAIDTERSPHIHPDVHFETMKFEDYTTDEVFDVVHARNVLPFFKDKPHQLARMLTMGKYVFFTFFGPHDPWASKNMTVSKEEMEQVLAGATILYFKEEEFEGPTMKGEIKPWHVYTYFVKTKLAE